MTKTSNKTTMYRHGDVLLIKVSEETEDKKNRNLTIAEGEVTGHHHVLEGEAWGTPELFRIEQPTPLTHPEHKTIILEPGTYKKSIEREYDPFLETIREVAD